VPVSRRYQLQSEEGNRLIDRLLDAVGVRPETRTYFAHMLTTVLKLAEDGTARGDLKIVSTALKELRYAFKVFAPYGEVPKVTIFGSARIPSEAPGAVAAREFGRRMVQAGWMVVTGAGAGIMGAAQEGAGGERSFGLNIRLPFEQEANPWIAADPKLITFKYFFTRKLFLIKEASAIALFPGGYGTGDEVFEALTLLQTGKSAIVPVVLVDVGPMPFWRPWERFVREHLVGQGLIDPTDLSLFRIVDRVEDAVQEILGFYRVYHSARLVGDAVVLRLHHALSDATLREIQHRFGDILKGPVDHLSGPLPEEEGLYPDLPRLVLPFSRSHYGRLRQLVDLVNTQ